MHPQLRKLVNKVKNKTLREKLVQFLENPAVEIAGEVYTGMQLDVARAPSRIFALSSQKNRLRV